jgi:dTDP-4-amino-4,6-dideoxygalactose transaminase
MDKQLALFGGQPIAPKIPVWPVHDEHEEQAVVEVVRSGVWGGFPEPAPRAARFAANFAQMHDAAYGIACANGTISMSTALLAADIGWGDEVLIPALSFVATAWAPLSVGAIPVICDLDPQTFCIDPRAIEAAITPRTRTIIPVHLGATIADMDAIMEIARKHNLIVIEDAAHAHAGQWRDKGAGSWGDFGSFSMQLSKTLTSGEGGMITTNDPDFAEACHSLVDCGRPKDPDGEVFRVGANFRITEFQAAILDVGLTRLLDQQEVRSKNMIYLDERLRRTEGMCPQCVDERVTRRPTYVYITQFDPAAFGGISSKQFASAMAAEGFPCGSGNPPMHRYDLLQLTEQNSFVYQHFKDKLDFSQMHFPVAEEVTQTTLWVAHPTFMAGTDLMDQFVEAVERVRANAKQLKDYDPAAAKKSAGPAHLRM